MSKFTLFYNLCQTDTLKKYIKRYLPHFYRKFKPYIKKRYQLCFNSEQHPKTTI